MKAISIWEPWASLMACGAKKNETRIWFTKYRGPLLICAAKRCRDAAGLEALRCAVKQGYGPYMKYGMAVCVVTLFGCIPTVEAMDSEDLELALGNYMPGRFAWLTNNLRQIKPFPVTGKQGLFNVDDSLIQYVTQEGGEG